MATMPFLREKTFWRDVALLSYRHLSEIRRIAYAAVHVGDYSTVYAINYMAKKREEKAFEG